MPSLHAAWAIVIGLALVICLQGPWRWLALLHPLTTIGVVVATGNHYWVDVIAAVALVALALRIHGSRPSSEGPASAPAGLAAGVGVA
jgi:hypothetical protein